MFKYQSGRYSEQKNLLYTGDSYKRTFANSKNPTEMPHHATFYQGLHGSLQQKPSLEKDMHFFLENVLCDPTICTIEHSKATVSNRNE